MPMNDVALTSAMRSTLLTLQTTQYSLDTIQQRLATGRKINSALDGPQAFFAAQSLSNRAKDLARLLDGALSRSVAFSTAWYAAPHGMLGILQGSI